MKTQAHKRKAQLGQGMTEYIIIVALIAIAGIAAFKLFGGTMQSQVGGIATELSGGDAETAISDAAGSASSAVDEGTSLEGLGNYNANNEAGE